MKSPNRQLITRLRKVGLITLIWSIVAMYESLIGFNALRHLAIEVAPINLLIAIKANLITGLIAGVVGGSFVVFAWERWLRTKPYGVAIKNILLSYTGIFLVVSIPTSTFYFTNSMNLSLSDPDTWKFIFSRIAHFDTLVPFTFWLGIVLLTIIGLLVNDKYGPGVFRKFLLGHYFKPQREERIFMFLDLRSSTAIAEQLGEEKYFNFLRDVFRFSTPSILLSKGEIYQYVGDEIVISWPSNSSQKEHNCIDCFFDIQSALKAKQAYFQDTYGCIPEFKAGLHFGYVMAGEIGVVKREIAYSGDVLNTTARIQSKCNELGVDILLSKTLIDRLLSKIKSYIPTEVGAIELRGKKDTVTLYTIQSV